MTRTVTMKDVAQQAGVSVATVSRVLNNTGFVSQELRERVNDAMRQLNYHPSNVARSLRRQQTQTVAVMVPQLDQPFFSTLTLAIQQRLFEEDFYVFTCSTAESNANEAAYVEMLLGQRVDGVIIAPTGHSPDSLRRLVLANVPVILVDRDIPEIAPLDRVLFDNRHGGHTGARHLVEQGHKRIAIIGGPAHSGAIKQRIDGARAALRPHPNVQLDIITPTSESISQFDIGYNAAQRVLAFGNRPSAIFALTDTAAVGVVHAAREMGITLPQELSVMGFDNIPLAQYSLPALTTVAQPIHEMGCQTADMLLKRLQNPDAAPYLKMNPAKLVIRDSTCSPQGE